MKDTVQFSNQGYSAFNLAQSAVDFAENGKSVSIKNCRFPLLIFAEMARRKHLPFGFHVQWIKDDEINKRVCYILTTRKIDKFKKLDRSL